MKKVLEEIYKILTTDTSLLSLLESTSGNKKIFPEIPANWENFPCLTYAIVDSYSATVPNNSRITVLELRVFAKNTTICENVFDRIDALLQYKQDWSKNIVYIRQSGELDLPEEDRKLSSKVMRYQVWCKT